jgi:hypothetical protein
MNTNKFFLGGIVGGIANFLLGWLVWGKLLMNFMKENSNQTTGVFRSENDMIWWAMIVGNLAIGFLISFILSKAKVRTITGGALTAGFAGLLISLGIDCMMYAQMDLFNTTGMMVDIAATTVVSAIVGAIVGGLNGRGAAS